MYYIRERTQSYRKMRRNLEDPEGSWKDCLELTWRVMYEKETAGGEGFFFCRDTVDLKCAMCMISLSKNLE